MRKLILFLLITPAFAATHWVSPTGAAAYSSCIGSTPISGASACSLATANANAVAGDLVYLRSGTYSGGTAIAPAHNGTNSGNMITFQGYPADGTLVAIISGGIYGIDLEGNSFISVLNIEFLNQTVHWGNVTEGANHNQIANNTFEVNVTMGAPSFFIGPNSDLVFPTHNWVHDNTFTWIPPAKSVGTEGSGCTDGGGDDLDIGQSGGTFGNTTGDNSNNNTVENNIFNHAPHAAFDGYALRTVFRNNVINNEPWSSGCSVTTNYSNTLYSNSAYNGKYAHRDAQYTEDFNRNMTFNLFEGNRFGYAGINQDNDGAENFDLATDGSILRYSFFYASMGTCLQFKYKRGNGVGSGGNGGTYNRTYNNTFYDCGVGWPPATLAVGSGCNTSSCPFAAVAISNYDGGSTGSAQGNVLKNNLIYEPHSLGLAIYHADAIDHSPGGTTPPFSPTISWSEFPTAVNNWCTQAQTSSGACSATGNPSFVNPDITNPSSRTLPDLSLQPGSSAIDGGTFLTTATNSGSGSSTITVADAQYFQDGTWGSDLSRPAAGLGGTMQADWICIGTVSNCVQISTVTYGTFNAPAGTITLASPMTWSNGASIWLYKKSDGTQVLFGAAPDYGAVEFNSLISVVNLNPTSLTFGRQLISTTSSGQTVTLTNTGGAVLNISGITITGANASEFAKTTTCGATVVASGSCTITATMAPTSLGAKAASISIASDAASTPDLVVMTGGGIPAAQVFAFNVPTGTQSCTNVNTGQGITTPAFIASHNYSSVRMWTQPTTPNGHFYKVTVTGTSSTEPSWNTGSGSTTTSGGVTFTEQGATNAGECLDEFFLYVLPNIDGAVLGFNAVDLDPSNVGGTAQAAGGYTFTNMDSIVNTFVGATEWSAANGVVMLLRPGTYSSPNSWTPTYWLNATYAATLGAPANNTCYCGGYPGDKAVGTNACSNDGDITGVPVPFDVPYQTAYNALLAAYTAHIKAATYHASVAAARHGISIGGEAFPFCVSQMKQKYSFSTAQIKTAWIGEVQSIANQLVSATPNYPVEGAMNGLCVPGTGGVVCYDWADAEAVIYTNAGFGITSQGFTVTDINAFATNGYASGGAATAPGTYCSNDFCYNFHTFLSASPASLQTGTATNPSGAGTGSLVDLGPFATQQKATILELYIQDLLIAYDPNFSQYSTYHTAYATAISNFRNNIIGPTSVPHGIYGQGQLVGGAKVQ